MSADSMRWTRESRAGVEIDWSTPSVSCTGGLIILTDPGWSPEAARAAVVLNREASSLLVAIPAVRSWWIDRPDPRFPESASPLAFVGQSLAECMKARLPETARIAILGVGLGGQGALQSAYRFPHLLPIVAAVAPAIDFHRLYDSAPQLQSWFESSEQARQETATLRLHPLNWPPHQWFACARGDWRFDGCERLASKLTSIGIPFEADLVSSGPDPEAYVQSQIARALDFVVARLKEPPTSREIRVCR